MVWWVIFMTDCFWKCPRFFIPWKSDFRNKHNHWCRSNLTVEPNLNLELFRIRLKSGAIYQIDVFWWSDIVRIHPFRVSKGLKYTKRVKDSTLAFIPFNTRRFLSDEFIAFLGSITSEYRFWTVNLMSTQIQTSTSQSRLSRAIWTNEYSVRELGLVRLIIL